MRVQAGRQGSGVTGDVWVLPGAHASDVTVPYADHPVVVVQELRRPEPGLREVLTRGSAPRGPKLLFGHANVGPTVYDDLDLLVRPGRVLGLEFCGRHGAGLEQEEERDRD